MEGGPATSSQALPVIMSPKPCLSYILKSLAPQDPCQNPLRDMNKGGSFLNISDEDRREAVLRLKQVCLWGRVAGSLMM